MLCIIPVDDAAVDLLGGQMLRPGAVGRVKDQLAARPAVPGQLVIAPEGTVPPEVEGSVGIRQAKRAGSGSRTHTDGISGKHGAAVQLLLYERFDSGNYRDRLLGDSEMASPELRKI